MTEYVTAVPGIKKTDINLTSWRDSLMHALTPRFSLEDIEHGYIDIDDFSVVQKAKLIELRKIIRETLPGTDEDLKWGAPATLDRDGMILVVFSGHKQHMNLVCTPSTKKLLKKIWQISKLVRVQLNYPTTSLYLKPYQKSSKVSSR